MPPLAEVPPWCRITLLIVAMLVFNSSCVHFNHLKDVSRFNVASLEVLAKQALHRAHGVQGGLGGAGCGGVVGGWVGGRWGSLKTPRRASARCSATIIV